MPNTSKSHVYRTAPRPPALAMSAEKASPKWPTRVLTTQDIPCAQLSKDDYEAFTALSPKMQPKVTITAMPQGRNSSASTDEYIPEQPQWHSATRASEGSHTHTHTATHPVCA